MPRIHPTPKRGWAFCYQHCKSTTTGAGYAQAKASGLIALVCPQGSLENCPPPKRSRTLMLSALRECVSAGLTSRQPSTETLAHRAHKSDRLSQTMYSISIISSLVVGSVFLVTGIVKALTPRTFICGCFPQR